MCEKGMNIMLENNLKMMLILYLFTFKLIMIMNTYII